VRTTWNSPGAAGIAAAVLACGAFAQEPGLVVVSPRPELKWLEFYSLDAAVELQYNREVSEVDPTQGSKTTDVEDRFREILELGTRGYAGHPNLLELDLSGGFRFTQRLLDEDTTGIDETVDDFLFEYDVSGLFFQQQKFPFTLYSRRTQSDVDRVFAGSLEQIWTQTGGRLVLRSDRFPTTIEAFVRELEQNDRSFNQDFTLDQWTVQADGRVDLGPTQRMSWDMKYDDIRESGDLRATRNFERFEANALHTLDFGPTDEHQLRSTLYYFDESGDFPFTQLQLTEQARFRPNRNLDVTFDFRLEDLDRSEVELRRYLGSGNFRHQLFDSLITTGRVAGIHQDLLHDPFKSDEVLADLAFDYTKRVPLGTFFAGLAVGWDRIWQEERGLPLPVVDNAFTFSPSGLIVITDDNIVASSIFITDLTGTIVYSLGTDYLQLVLPDRAEIQALPPGLNPGDMVLIDYTIGPEPAGRTTVSTGAVNVRYTFDEGPLAGLSVYTGYRAQDEDRSPEEFVAEQPDNDFTELRYGMEYNAWKLYLKAEQQVRDSDVSSFDSTWLEARYTEPLGRGSSLALSASYQYIDRDEVDTRTATTTFSGSWNQRITDHLQSSLILLYQDIDANVGFDSEAFEQQLNLRWQYRRTEIYAQLRNRWRNNTGADDTFFQTIAVGVRREF
jgi:hypothetical protein